MPVGERSGSLFAIDPGLTGGQVVSSLHALTDLPRSSFVGTWGIFTEICTWAVLFSAASGIYLMTARKEEQRIGWTVFVTASVASLGLFVYVLVVG